ncbi:hypothetical protein FC83_GL001844 [Agrilactobacillus composti DSM 18527 = JCM 14202]|uniref:HTH cro/C1-type domain-containing protein n=1 Tax=Agrilactobacillus composti DSM 18527 = JCM 14202 TaxID=1423734 RepID=X0PQD7_9LACO|nr:helix-turn-helix transcriptional regulator [Agrilactobacillus composti]KRM34998.1 hypothetical protein FC83_GL001844 [Agrilactobacillus composti DSM 18527 = JCM 14202]GAF39306.1 hypothetical protein JCM14202_1159 [Agrilactobacillus composti DSM 18527 = JCM 14202]
MTTWHDYKSGIKAIRKENIAVIEMLADLQSERLKRGIKQKDFAEQIGMKPAQLAKIERLDSVPTLGTLTRYAKGLGLTIKLSSQP